MVRTIVATTAIEVAAAVAAISVAMGFDMAPALAGPCTAQIAQVEASAHQGITSGEAPPGPSGQQSVGAQLHHQPTPGSVKQAEAQTDAAFKALLESAKKLDAQGKSDECMAKVEELRRMLGL